MPSRQAVVIACVLLVGATGAWVLAGRSRDRVIEAGFWFEPVTFESSALGHAPTTEEMGTIEAVAMSELTRAFDGLRLDISDRRDAPYRIRVVQELRDLRFRRYVGIAGEARAVSGIGGQAAVNFSLLASHAVGYAAHDADRAEKIAAIGRGIGRAAAHELAHLLLPSAALHGPDVGSYEYASPARREQYYGEMQWDFARPLMEKRLAR